MMLLQRRFDIVNGWLLIACGRMLKVRSKLQLLLLLRVRMMVKNGRRKR